MPELPAQKEISNIFAEFEYLKSILIIRYNCMPVKMTQVNGIRVGEVGPPLFDVPITHRKSKIKPNSLHYDVRMEAVTTI